MINPFTFETLSSGERVHSSGDCDILACFFGFVIDFVTFLKIALPLIMFFSEDFYEFKQISIRSSDSECLWCAFSSSSWSTLSTIRLKLLSTC